MFQIPELARARQVPFQERVALAEELGHQLIAVLEEEGYHAHLPEGFRAVGAPLPPISDDDRRPAP
jgi:hypothetical protein